MNISTDRKATLIQKSGYPNMKKTMKESYSASAATIAMKKLRAICWVNFVWTAAK